MPSSFTLNVTKIDIFVMAAIKHFTDIIRNNHLFNLFRDNKTDIFVKINYFTYYKMSKIKFLGTLMVETKTESSSLNKTSTSYIHVCNSTLVELVLFMIRTKCEF